MPLLFSLGIHDAFAEVSAQLQPNEHVFAYLDDVYVVVKPERIRAVYDLLASTLQEKAGIRLHTGKTRTWNRARRACPRSSADPSVRAISAA